MEYIKNNTKPTDECVFHLIHNPRVALAESKKLGGSFLSENVFFDWFYDYYYPKYEKIIRKIWTDTESLDDVVKIMPNINPWAFTEKGDELGSVPFDFNDKETFVDILEDIMSSEVVQKYIHIQDLTLSFKQMIKEYPQAEKIDFTDLGAKATFLHNLLKKETARPFSIIKKGISYEVSTLANPFTKKIVFKIKANGNGYILKIARGNILNITNDEQRQHKENQLLRADSPFINALVDFYLSYNRSVNVAEVCYYSLSYDAVLYKITEGEIMKSSDISSMNPIAFNRKYLADANALGIFLNDINAGNFIKDVNGGIKIIDTGHCAYSNPFNTGVSGINFTLGNLCGRDVATGFAALYI